MDTRRHGHASAAPPVHAAMRGVYGRLRPQSVRQRTPLIVSANDGMAHACVVSGQSVYVDVLVGPATALRGWEMTCKALHCHALADGALLAVRAFGFHRLME